MSFYVSIFLFFHGVTLFPLVYSLAFSFSFQPDSASGGFVYVYRQQQCLKKNRFFIFLFKLVPIQQKYNVKRTTYTSTNDYSLILFNFICFDQPLLCKFFFSLDKINNKNAALNKISSNSMESQKKKLDTRQANMNTIFK